MNLDLVETYLRRIAEALEDRDLQEKDQLRTLVRLVSQDLDRGSLGTRDAVMSYMSKQGWR